MNLSKVCKEFHTKAYYHLNHLSLTVREKCHICIHQFYFDRHLNYM